MLSHLKKRLGVLTAIAVMAALVPALSTSVASAAPATTATAPLDVTDLSACPASASIPAAGFTDTTSTAVDCIKYYGITTGVTATTYEPAANIPRWQMALYLTRAADVMNVTLGTGADQGFTDISGYSAAIQTAINQIKQLGVTTGTTATTYDPDSNVTREQMAMFVNRLLAITTVGPNGSADTALTPSNINGATATYNYTDIDSGVTYEGHNSIVEMYNLGVPGHAKTVTTFGPTSAIPRSEMATWMTNALAHSNARPEGLVLQATSYSDFGQMDVDGVPGVGDELHVSIRDASYNAVVDTLVDVFGYVSSTTVGSAAFTAAGVCKNAEEASSGTDAECTIENTDYITDSAGNVVITGAHEDVDVDEGKTVQYWAWQGAVAATFLNGTTTHSTVTVTSAMDADAAKIACDGTTADQGDPAVDGRGKDYDSATDEATQAAKYGTTVTCTITAWDGTGTTSKAVAKAGVRVNVADKRGTDGAAATSLTNTVVTTGADGTGTYTTTIADPGLVAGAGNDAATYQILTLSNSAANTTTLANFFQVAGTNDAIKGFMWDDTARAEYSVVVTGTRYVDASSVGTGATNTISATSYDQYGVGVAGNALTMTTTGAVGLGQTDTSTYSAARTADSSGTATWGVTRDAATDLAETFTVSDGSNTGTFTSYWPVSSSTTAFNSMSTAALIPDVAGNSATWTSNTLANLVVADTANDTFILAIKYGAAEGNTCTSTVAGHDQLSACTHVRYTYDSDDAFFKTGAASTYAAFDYALSLLEGAGTNQLTAVTDMFSGTAANIGEFHQAIPGNASHFRMP